MRRVFTIAVFGSLLVSQTVVAAPPADQLLPTSTKGFLSVPNVEDLETRWNQTQLGKLAADPVMKPFAEDLQRQIQDKLLNSRFNISVSWDELAAACGGELCLAAIQPNNDPELHAAVMIIDAQGRHAEAQRFLDNIANQLQEKGAKRTVEKVGQHELVIHELPRERGQIEPDLVYRFMIDDSLVIADDEGVARELLTRLVTGDRDESLSTVTAYREVMNRVAADAGAEAPQARWFIDPFDYALVMRAADDRPRKRRKDMLAIFRSQGFDAIQALGGYIHFADGKHEILHRTMIYAPAVEPTPTRYRLAARMLNFPNDTTWNWKRWIPRELASATNFRWKTQDAFDYSKTLVDAIAGSEGFFDDLLKSIKNDPNGPQIDVRQEFVKFLGEDVTVLSDYVYPITPKSERMLVAVAVSDEEAVRRTVTKALATDPDARRIDVGQHTIWEILDQEEEAGPDLDLDLDGIDPIGNAPAAEPDDKEEEKILRNSAIMVAHGHVMVATHVDFLRRIVEGRAEDDQLMKCEDFHLIEKHLREIGANEDCVRFFTRTDEAYRPTYELIRQGRMPESESMLGKLLNRWLGPEDEGLLREQQIDGSQLPDYQTVRRYLGPSGSFMRAEEDGWFSCGCLLNKQTAFADGVGTPAITASAEEQSASETR